jgi:hypothetical protein
MAVVASACESPNTLGTTGETAGPVEMTRETWRPGMPRVPATGVWLSTLPTGAALDAVVIGPTVKPALVMAVVASACVSPTTFGTVWVADRRGGGTA